MTTKKILIIDDENTIRESLETFLKEFSYDVISVASAEEGLTLMKTENPDFVIVDIRLPGMSGDEFIRKVCLDAQETGFLIHTGSLEYIPDSISVCPHYETIQVLTKPVFPMSRYLDIIQDYFSSDSAT